MSGFIGDSDFELTNKVFCIIDDKVEERGISSLTPEQMVVYFVWGSWGLLGNGSFQYFFENEFDAEASAQSFNELGFFDIADCLRKALQLLPSNFLQMEWKTQHKLLEQNEDELDALANKILAHKVEVFSNMANYIRGNSGLMALIQGQ